MHFFKTISAIAFIAILTLIIGCSGSETPLVPNSTTNSPNTNPIIGLCEAGSTFNAIGLMGAYELVINPGSMTAELISKRFSSIGESWVVSGISYFTILPCTDCLAISGLSLTPEGNVELSFSIKHPFKAGNTSEDPSAVNRLDLDLFDVALVIAPLERTPTTFPQYYEKIYNNICVNPDGYTMELFEVTLDDAAMPYFLVVDENDSDPVPSPTTWNKFAMGAEETFDVVFSLVSNPTLKFDLYLTMGYGHSAKKADRLAPKYFNPEFNRKSAWKVVATPPEGNDAPTWGNTWDDLDSTTFYNVLVEVYDWQTDAVVSTETDFADADSSEVYASSEVSAVHVEIAGMASGRSTLSVDDGTGTGMPGSPLVYNVPIRNENLLSAGEYPGLVTVIDDRIIADPSLDTRDYLIDCPDGSNLLNYSIPAFQTYQTFTATVLVAYTDYDWTKTWGGNNIDQGLAVALDHAGNIYVTGRFRTTVDFNPDGGGTQSSDGLCNAYLSKFDSEGVWLWTRTWGGTLSDRGYSVALDQAGNAYVTGYFYSSADFNPDGGGTQTSHGSGDAFLSKFDSSGNWQWSKTWGGADYDQGLSLASDQSGNTYVAGRFRLTVDFNPDGGGTQTSSGSCDAFLSKFDSSGNWLWTKTWGGSTSDRAYCVALDSTGNAYITGYFNGTIDFNPDGGGTQSSNGNTDVFLSKFNSAGNWQWSETWGGTGGDRGNWVSLDQTGNAYVTGYFYGSADFNPDGGDSQSSNGLNDVFLSKFDSSGNWQWSKTWGGVNYDHGNSVSIDMESNAYVAGYFYGTVDFNPDSGGTKSSNGGDDVFLSKFDSTGTWQWSEIWGGTGRDWGWSVVLNQENSAYVTGYFNRTVDFNPDPGDDSYSSNGFDDTFLWKGSY